MNKNQLRIEDVLKEEDIVNEMKKNSSSQFYSMYDCSHYLLLVFPMK